MADNRAKKYTVGDVAACRCGEAMVITAAMVRYGKYQCGRCRSRLAVAHAKSHRGTKRASNSRYWKSLSPQERTVYSRRYRREHPEKKAAHQAVQTAIRNGSLTHEACSVCGADNAHAHHDDYTKPLRVIWLCHQHHMERHAMLIEQKKREGEK